MFLPVPGIVAAFSCEDEALTVNRFQQVVVAEAVEIAAEHFKRQRKLDLPLSA